MIPRDSFKIHSSPAHMECSKVYTHTKQQQNKTRRTEGKIQSWIREQKSLDWDPLSHRMYCFPHHWKFKTNKNWNDSMAKRQKARPSPKIKCTRNWQRNIIDRWLAKHVPNESEWNARLRKLSVHIQEGEREWEKCTNTRETEKKQKIDRKSNKINIRISKWNTYKCIECDKFKQWHKIRLAIVSVIWRVHMNAPLSWNVSIECSINNQAEKLNSQFTIAVFVYYIQHIQTQSQTYREYILSVGLQHLPTNSRYKFELFVLTTKKPY